VYDFSTPLVDYIISDANICFGSFMFGVVFCYNDISCSY